MADWFPAAVVHLHLAATLVMVGVIWFVQVVHYPLFAGVGRPGFDAYAREHVRRTGWVVAPAMVVEAAAAVLLLGVRPPVVPVWVAGVGAALLAVIWASTRAVQVPCHDRLARGYDPAVHRRLVSTNWVRTACWSVRGLLALGLASQLP